MFKPLVKDTFPSSNVKPSGRLKKQRRISNTVEAA